MDASPVNIVQYFDGSKQSMIPLFQRPYSWEKKNWRQLWDDIIDQYEPSGRRAHFMGAVVTVPVKSVPVGVAKHLVIDGQQRLTTLALLMAAIRDLAHESGDEKTTGIVGDLLINRHHDEPDDLKLLPTQADRDAYVSVVKGNPAVAAKESKLTLAYRFFAGKLREDDEEGEAFLPSRVLEALQQSLQVVMINLGESDDPYLIFESLNHKGKRLSQADLVRNYVLMRFRHSPTSDGEQRQVYEGLWRPMEDGLGDEMTEFLRHHGMRRGVMVRKPEVYSAVKREFEELKEAADVRTRLGAMRDSASDYERILHPDRVSDTLTVPLQRLKAVEPTVFYPLLLRLFALERAGDTDAAAVARCLVILESFWVRRTLCAVPTNALNKLTLDLCGKIERDRPDRWLHQRLSAGTKTAVWPSDDEFRFALIHSPLYDRRRIRLHLLAELEATYAHKEPASTENATIEHLMPQTLTPDWRAALGDDADAQHGRWLHTLGNLTLTGYNSELGNLSFAEKKVKLADTHFELTRQTVLAAGDWAAQEIEARGCDLAERALTRWPRAEA